MALTMFRRCNEKDLLDEIVTRKSVLNIDMIKEASDLIYDFGDRVFLTWTKAHSSESMYGNIQADILATYGREMGN
jgi:ribonuclease HI